MATSRRAAHVTPSCSCLNSQPNLLVKGATQEGFESAGHRGGLGTIDWPRSASWNRGIRSPRNQHTLGMLPCPMLEQRPGQKTSIAHSSHGNSVEVSGRTPPPRGQWTRLGVVRACLIQFCPRLPSSFGDSPLGRFDCAGGRRSFC
jgi:hypothetical protein